MFSDTIAPMHLVHHLDNSGYNDFSIVAISDSVLNYNTTDAQKIDCKVGNKYLAGLAAVPVSSFLNDTLVEYDLTRISGHTNFEFPLNKGTYHLHAFLGDWRNEKPNLLNVKSVQFAINVQ